MVRAPTEDDILPLTKPIVGASGRVYTELPIPKGTPTYISVVGYNLCVSFTVPPLLPQRYSHIVIFVIGTRICGVQTLTCSGQSGGSKWTSKLSRPSGCMGTCMYTREVLTVLSSIDRCHSALPSPEASGAASGGDLRALIGFHASR